MSAGHFARIKRDESGDLHVSFHNGYNAVVPAGTQSWRDLKNAVAAIRATAEPSPEKLEAQRVPRKGSAEVQAMRALMGDVDTAIANLNTAYGALSALARKR